MAWLDMNFVVEKNLSHTEPGTTWAKAGATKAIAARAETANFMMVEMELVGLHTVGRGILIDIPYSQARNKNFRADYHISVVLTASYSVLWNM